MTDRFDSTLRLVELAEVLRGMEAQVLHAQALVSGIDPAIPATFSVHLSSRDAAELKSLCETVVTSSDRLQELAAILAEDEIEIRWRDLEREASAELALGVGDPARAEFLARCLSVREGFRALAEMLRCTDCHETWDHTTLADVLGRFRDADPHFIRRLTAQALLSPEARFDSCDRDQIARLAGALEAHAATTRCR
jgi:hypothetical protein